jgi:Tol biopolymer transport system component
VRLTSGVGEYQEARLSKDRTQMVATLYDFKRTLATLPITGSVDRPTPIGNGYNGDLDPAVSPGGDRLAFSSTRTGDRAIWTSKLDGSDLRQVTANGFDERPQWSPDGRTIAFVASREGARGIWTVAAEGGPTKRVVVANTLGGITWSPNGTEIAYAAPDGSAPALFRVGLDGTTATKIPTPFPANSPNWSRVSRQLAYMASPPVSAPGTRTWIARLSDALAPIDSPPTTNLANGMVAWSPDGKWLAGISIPGGAQALVWVLPADGHEPPRQLFQTTRGDRMRGIDWMPDGTRVIVGLEQRTADIVLFDQGSRKP